MTHTEKVRSLAIVLAALDDRDGTFDWQAPRYMALAEFCLERLEHPTNVRVIEYGELQGDRPRMAPELTALDRILGSVLGVTRRQRPVLRSIPTQPRNSELIGEGDTLAAGGMRAEDAYPWLDDPPMH